MNKHYRIKLTLFCLCLLIIGMVNFWIYGSSKSEQSKQAYVQGHSMMITVPYDGEIAKVYAQSFTNLEKGAALFALDGELLKSEYSNLKAEYGTALSQLELARLKEQHARQGIKLLTERQEAAQQKYQYLCDLVAKYQKLDIRDLGEVEYTGVRARQAEARENYFAVSVELEKSQETFKEAGFEVKVKQAKLKQIEEQLQHKQLVLNRSLVKSPVAGTLGEVKLEAGQIVKAHELFAQLYYDADKWVVANFTEKQLKKLKIGQEAIVTLDAFPNILLPAKITLLAPATIKELKLNPWPEHSEKARRNEQNFPVIVDIIEPNPLQDQIKAGMLAKVIVKIDEKK